MSDTCVKCFRPLARGPVGRPAAYCSPGCRRAAEYELRRLQRRLERLEDERERWRRAVAGVGFFTGSPAYASAMLARVEAEVAEAEARLRSLLSEGDDDG